MAEQLPVVPELVVPFTHTVEEMAYDIAVLLNNTVYQILSTDGQSAALFLEQPSFVQVDKTQVVVGQTYDPETQTFAN